MDENGSLVLEMEGSDGATVVRVRGSVGINEADEFRSALDDLLANDASVIVLDLRGMDFICSSGLGAMITADKSCRSRGGGVRLVSPRPNVENLLEMTRLTKLFGIYPTVEAALAAGPPDSRA